MSSEGISPRLRAYSKSQARFTAHRIESAHALLADLFLDELFSELCERVDIIGYLESKGIAVPSNTWSQTPEGQGR